MARSDRWPTAGVIGALASLGACADLIGANFEPYDVEPTSTSSAATTDGASTATTATASTTTGDGGGSSTGAGGDGGSGGTSDTSSSSSGTSCEEWPAGSGEWQWATQIALDDGATLDLAAVVPSNSPVFPFAAVGTYAGTIFEGSDAETTSDNVAPFMVSVGPSGIDLGGALAVECSGTCGGVEVADAGTDPVSWQDFEAIGWLTGNFRGSFGADTSGEPDTPYVMRYRQDATPEHRFEASTFIPSETGEGSDAGGTYFGIDVADGLIAVAGDALSNGMFGLTGSQFGSRFLLGLAIPQPIFLDRRAGRLTRGATASACDPRDFRQREVDVAIAGSKVWSAGRFCGSGPAAGVSAQEPGDGFVILQGVTLDQEAGETELGFEGAGEFAVEMGVFPTAVAAIDSTSAVIAGEIAKGDGTIALPDDTERLPDEGGGFVSLLEVEGGELVARWVAELDAPGEQHVVDVAVHRIDDETIEVYVTGVTDEPFSVGGFTAPCDFEGAPLAFVAKLDDDGQLVWIRTFGREGVRPVQLRIADDGVVVGAVTGLGGYALEPRAPGVDPLELLTVSHSAFVAQLSF